MKNKLLVTLILIIIIFALNSNIVAYSPEKADFSLEYNGFEIPFKTFSIFVLPGEEICLEIVSGNENRVIAAQ